MTETDVDSPGNTMGERVAGNRVKLWLLLDADRWAVTGAVVSVVAGTVGPVSIRDAVTGNDPSVVSGATLGVANLLLLVAGAVAVAKRTLAVGPFALRDADRSADIDRGS